jgi:predicted enzyme related to lactoylglutathione lyase
VYTLSTSEVIVITSDIAFSGFAAKDIDAARTFYGETLGVKLLPNPMGMVELDLGTGASVIIYPKPDHVPATYTVLNFVVADIDKAVEELAASGVEVIIYPGNWQDDKGVARGIATNNGPDIAWFTDPDGNILSVLQNA